MQEKYCPDCQQTKLVSDFNAHKATPDGYETRCKTCRTRKVETDRANRAFCEEMRVVRYQSMYPSPQYIYGLHDPRTGELRYIGRSHNPTKRLQTHENMGSGENWKLRTWISELRAMGLQPDVKIIEQVAEDEFVVEREYRWILKGIRDGLPLLNAEAHQGGIRRDGRIAPQVMESPCADFLTEPRDLSLLRAIEGWYPIIQAGNRWFRKPVSLEAAIRVCLKKCPNRLPPRLLPMAQELSAKQGHPLP